MQLCEHQGKALIAEAGIPVPEGRTAMTPQHAAEVASALGGPVVLKSQVPAGKRGKTGAILFASSPGGAAEAAGRLLGSSVSGFDVHAVLVERQVDIAAELYAAVLNDADTRGPLVLFSTQGGMDIEEAGEKVLRLPVDIRTGLDEAMARSFVASSGLSAGHVTEVAGVLTRLYQVYRDNDAELVEVNPLVIARRGGVVALDCKLSLDPGGLRRHPDLVARFEAELPDTGTELEREARRQGLLFIELDGDVGILANGAGLTMETLDAVHHYGGRPANFLEIGGDAYTKATPALRLVLANPRVRSLLVSFCGAFARTDVMTEGVIVALETLRPAVPVSFTVHGTGEEEAIGLLRDRLGVEPYERMEDAVREAVENARARAEVEA